MKAKTTKILGMLLLAGLTLTGCDETNNGDNGGNEADNAGQNYGDGGESGASTYDPNKSAWSDVEKAIFANYLYNAEIPYINVNNETELSYDEENLSATKTAPVSSAEILAQYARLFDDSWDNYSYLNDDDDGKYYYAYEKGFETEAGTRYVTVQFYGGDYNDTYGDYEASADGTGTFVLEIFDPYEYEWPAELISQVIAAFELQSTIPAINAEYYEFEDSYLYFGYLYLGVYAYCDATVADAYVEALTTAGFTKYDTDKDGYDSYKTTFEDISISIKYYGEYRCLDIEIMGIEKKIEGDTLDATAFSIANDSSYKDYTAVAASGAEYKGCISGASADIQLKSGDNKSGIVVTKSAGIVKGIGFTSNTSTANRSVQIYGSNEPFEISDMYNSDDDSIVLVATISVTGNGEYFEYEFEDEYAYIGIRSAKGALNLEEIIIAWDNGEDDSDDDDDSGEETPDDSNEQE